MSTNKQTALIIGAGPAGLTAALELLRRTGTIPIVLEKSSAMGGLSRTVKYKGNRMDIGGHRFFSKSDRVMNWWLEILPPEATNEATEYISYQNKHRAISTNGNRGLDPDQQDAVMLIRNRKSRIYFLRKFFDYPISLSARTLRNLGALRTIKIGASYATSVVRQIKPERTLEHFLINRFGKQLYLTFFKSYTEKVWGVPCSEISAEWGAQRIKGLSIATALLHIAKKLFRRQSGIQQKKVETSLIEKFLYPKYGPGQLWERVAENIVEKGGQILTGYSVDKLVVNGSRVIGVEAIGESGERRRFEADYVFSTMPIKELIRALGGSVPENVREVSDGLIYRDFITVGMLLNRLQISEDGKLSGQLLRDNWIYIQEPDVLVGRMQIFNNWSPYMVADPSKVWVGLEYFCYETDELWHKPDQEMIKLATEEMERIGIVSAADVLDAVVIRVPKTYPAYFGTYNRFPELREYIDGFENLFLVGRNGMHKYNNQDHSMLTAMTAVDNIVEGRRDKSNIWAVNTEQEYHEDKKEGNRDAEFARAGKESAAASA
ncbi:MAG TPA: NAD(P)/FAD-dependent oxidoreductase [Bryobacteraceae bacterium]|nr:NAD(P)/FAD-dependent oxidoreductase [Bryobacteraceae bacterium]